MIRYDTLRHSCLGTLLRNTRVAKRSRSVRKLFSDDARASAAKRRAQQLNLDVALKLVEMQALCTSQDECHIVQCLQRYQLDVESVPGFFEPGLLPILYDLHKCQRIDEVHGAVAEIGVYHGRSFVPLAMLRSDREASQTRTLTLTRKSRS